MDEDFVNDAGFDIEKYLTQKLGKSFGKAEDNAFINGTGADEPTDILQNNMHLTHSTMFLPYSV